MRALDAINWDNYQPQRVDGPQNVETLRDHERSRLMVDRRSENSEIEGRGFDSD